MLSTFFAYSMLTSMGVPFVATFFLTIAFAFALGAAVYTAFLRPAKDPTVLGLIIMTLGVEMILYGIASWQWGADTKRFPSPISDQSIHRIGGRLLIIT